MPIHKPIPKFSEKRAARFWSRVDKRGPDECWPWKGTKQNAKTHWGRYGLYGKGSFRANRIAYFLWYGDDPGEMLVCHSCDTPLCCNGRHLFKGTGDDNMKDMAVKRRSCIGESNPRAKLTASDVLAMRELYKAVPNYHEIGRRFGVCGKVAREAIIGIHWRHISMPQS